MMIDFGDGREERLDAEEFLSDVKRRRQNVRFMKLEALQAWEEYYASLETPVKTHTEAWRTFLRIKAEALVPKEQTWFTTVNETDSKGEL
jgi:hypothetical protein